MRIFLAMWLLVALLGACGEEDLEFPGSLPDATSTPDATGTATRTPTATQTPDDL